MSLRGPCTSVQRPKKSAHDCHREILRITSSGPKVHCPRGNMRIFQSLCRLAECCIHCRTNQNATGDIHTEHCQKRSTQKNVRFPRNSLYSSSEADTNRLPDARGTQINCLKSSPPIQIPVLLKRPEDRAGTSGSEVHLHVENP